MKLHNRYILAIILICCAVLKSAAESSGGAYVPLDSANKAYGKGDYQKAIIFYQNFLNGGIQSAQAYYNLGNCYYKLNEVGKAILFYEKAEKLLPGDPDIQFNLQLANQKITDKVPSDSPVFLYTGWKKFVNKFTEKQWSIIGILILCFCLLLFALYLIFNNKFLKQFFFWSGFAIFFVSIFAFFLARQQYEILNSHDTAIVMSASVTVRSAPEDKATQLFVIHEGTKISIIKNEGIWTEIKLSNGNQGWLNSSEISVI